MRRLGKIKRRLIGIVLSVLLMPFFILICFILLPERYQFYIVRPISRIFHYPLSSLLPLTCEMAFDFDRLPGEKWLEHMESIPTQLRFPVFNLSEPDTRVKLLEMMLARVEQSAPEKKAVITSLKEKTIEFYRLQNDSIVNSAETNRLFSEVGEDWLNSLTPEEKALAVEVHQKWFVPELTIRHGNVVWVVPDRMKSVNEQFERYAGKYQRFQEVSNRTEQETILLLAFPWDMQSPDFAAKYETDGLFVAPRRESCNCGTDIDCLPGTRCQIPFPGLSPDHLTACHLLGVLIPCRGRCVSGQ